MTVDDDMSQNYLAAKHFIDIRDIPSNGEFRLFFSKIISTMHHIEEMKRRVKK